MRVICECELCGQICWFLAGGHDAGVEICLTVSIIEINCLLVVSINIFNKIYKYFNFLAKISPANPIKLTLVPIASATQAGCMSAKVSTTLSVMSSRARRPMLIYLSSSFHMLNHWSNKPASVSVMWIRRNTCRYGYRFEVV